ncbi:MAG: hypothetical protein M3209_01160 [Acidobacteriota bacterium]|nr:hypothetical protein [Acidobacteriota bacterium]
MTTNIEKPVGPGTFTRNSCNVTIAEDGKILVKKDDWLSKYSWALYGDFDTLEVFVRPNPAITSPIQQIKGIKEIEDVDLIETGEYLIHEPTYFHWMEKRSNLPVPKKPKPPQEKKPENARSTNWKAANLGGLDGTYLVGSAGAFLLAFRNLDINKDFYHVLLRAGGGLGLDLGNIIKDLKKLIRALGAAFLMKKAATAKFVPVMTHIPFSARSVEGLTIRCHGWNGSTGGPKQNYSYEKITGYTSRFDYFSVVFEETDWVALPGGSVNFTGGKLIWIW